MTHSVSRSLESTLINIDINTFHFFLVIQLVVSNSCRKKTPRRQKKKQKKAKKEGGAMRRPAAVPKGSGVPTEPKELKEPKESKKGKEPKEPKNGKEPKEPKKSKEPKEPKKATKVPKEKVNKGTKRKGTASDDAAISQSPRTDDGDQEAKKLSDKEKRRLRSVESWKRLKEAGIKDLEIPSDLKGRISFTVRDPAEVGSSVGVLLASDAFYISKAVPPPKWPTNCNHLKVGGLCVAFESMLHF